MRDTLNFDGRVAIVTGAGRGLGRAYARLLAGKGARVAVNDLGGGAFGGGASRQPASDCVEEIAAAGGEAFANFADVTDEAAVAQLVAETLERYGRIDILINNAGIARFRQFDEMTRAEFDLMLRVHVSGSWQVAHAVWPHLVRQGYGRIVMTGSSGMAGVASMSHYATAKAATYGLMKSLSLAGSEHGILVNAIWPSADTPLFEAIKADIAGAETVPLETAEATKPQLIGTPEMVAPVAAWLAHADCRSSGEIFHAGSGLVGNVFLAHGPVFYDAAITMESVRDHWAQVCDKTSSTPIDDSMHAHKTLEAGHH